MVFSSSSATSYKSYLRQDLAPLSLKPYDGDDVDNIYIYLDDTTQVKLGVHARRATVDDVH